MLRETTHLVAVEVHMGSKCCEIVVCNLKIMAVNLTLSSEQAALLLPILQHISYQQTVVPDKRSLCSLGSPPSGSRSSYGKVESSVSTSELVATNELL